MIAWETWRAKPVVLQMARFTGFGSDGNGYELLEWLHEHGIRAVRDGQDIRLNAQGRDDARAYPGDWVAIGTCNEVYPIRPDVHASKYEPAGEWSCSA